MKLRGAPADVLGQLRAWLEEYEGTELSVCSCVVSDRLSLCVVVSRSYSLRAPHGTWASIVDMRRSARPFELAIEQATTAFEQAFVADREERQRKEKFPWK